MRYLKKQGKKEKKKKSKERVLGLTYDYICATSSELCSINGKICSSTLIETAQDETDLKHQDAERSARPASQKMQGPKLNQL